MEANSRATGSEAGDDGEAGGDGDAGRPARKSKSGYHHGDLRNALIHAAIELAVEGGPDAVVLRAAARKVGVSATAAYRHFDGQGELLHAVKEYGQQRLVERMEAGGREVDGDGPEAAQERVLALGRSYIRFAREEPGLYRTAFCPESPARITFTAEDGLGAPELWEARSFEMLIETLDELVAAGVMSRERRPGAEVSAWATVHGLAMLLLDGPLDMLAGEQVHYLIERVLRDILAGLTAP
ncbi:TetR/AcrR family transcriptional regulator [Streptomyces sp. NBC_01186]|uniref:TetR/AcrR family transcriptional regulator n=1 Tax=Streptomyces sp. NBC_01186 TaxID=2903765 RepID=UPI002E1355E1|nr:TetR/AcrR family transcriptional regulator [Streptomyces sp. NBC_01186]